jgi:catalase
MQGFVSVPARIRAEEEQGKVRAKPEKFADHYTQAKLFYESQTPVEQVHIANAFRFELSKVTVPAVRERMVAGLRNASEQLAKMVADGLGMNPLPEPLPLALPNPPKPEVTKSPALSLLARPGKTPLKGRKVALLVAPGADAQPLLQLQEALLAQGAVGRLVGPRIGPMATARGEVVEADASLENEPGFLFDGLVLPDGDEAVAALAQDGHTAEFIRDQFRHCKTILAIGASRKLLTHAGVPIAMDKSLAQGGTGLIVVDADAAAAGLEAFLQGLAKHRHFGREMDPPLV